MKHSEKTRAEALEMMAREGVAKTHEKMGITKATLYKWRNEANAPKENVEVASEDKADTVAKARAVLAESEKTWADEKEQLKAEIAALRSENEKLRNALRDLLA